MAKSDHIWKGDTWGMTEKECPECGSQLATNFKIDDCTECNYWEKIDQ